MKRLTLTAFLALATLGMSYAQTPAPTPTPAPGSNTLKAKKHHERHHKKTAHTFAATTPVQK